MLIRSYLYTQDKNESFSIIENAISVFKGNFTNYTILKNEPYWKDPNLFVVEVKLSTYTSFSIEDIEEGLRSIADKWLYFGNPVDEALASDTMEGCRFLITGVKMINIFI